MAKFMVSGTTTIDVYVIVEAETEDEALEKAEECGFSPEEYSDETVGVSYSDDVDISDIQVRASGWIEFTDVEEV